MLFVRSLLSIGLLLAPLVYTNPISDAGDALTARSGGREVFGRASLKAGDYTCPATHNGAGRDYPEHKYTSGQVEAAYKKAQGIQKDKGSSWKPQQNDYPHFFNNDEEPRSECGKSKAEYPLRTDGQTWSPGESVAQSPDRVVSLGTVSRQACVQYSCTKICGVIRHGPRRDFLQCHD
ncbi:hypothetical protein AAE478_005992 [Parahypoxylon ruwenzoriense]